MGWCKARDAILTELWQAHSASDIAARIMMATNKKTTKNSVISRARRLRLPSKINGRRSKAPAKRDAKSFPSRKKERPAAITRLSARGEVTALAGAGDDRPRRTILTVGRLECRYPLGEPDQFSFGVCGDKTDGKIYCARHYGVAYVSAPKRTGHAGADDGHHTA